MKIVYVGELSAVVPSELGFEVKRGVPFVAPDAFAKSAIRTEPSRWREATKAEAEALDDALAEEKKLREESQRQADEISLAHAMADAEPEPTDAPATGGGGTGDTQVDEE